VWEGIAASIGSIGDAYDNALVETIGLFKTEAIAWATPFRTGPFRIPPASSTATNMRKTLLPFHENFADLQVKAAQSERTMRTCYGATMTQRKAPRGTRKVDPTADAAALQAAIFEVGRRQRRCGTCEVYPANRPPALLRRVTRRGISPVHGDIA
jgi:hypothetical protein